MIDMHAMARFKIGISYTFMKASTSLLNACIYAHTSSSFCAEVKAEGDSFSRVSSFAAALS